MARDDIKVKMTRRKKTSRQYIIGRGFLINIYKELLEIIKSYTTNKKQKV
jgi:hypothetical protein